MRGSDSVLPRALTAARQATMLAAITPDALAPESHPIRQIKPKVSQPKIDRGGQAP